MKYLYNAKTVDARYPHQTIKCYKPGSPSYEHEMHWAKWATHAGEVMRDPFHTMPDHVANNIDEFLEALKTMGYGGIEQFIDQDGTLYTVHQEPAYEYAPLEYDGQHDWTGINWATAWFFTKEAALAFQCPNRQYDEPEYHEDLDTWSVHYHR